MRWITALFLGALLGFVMPQFFGGASGLWMNSMAEYGTIRPIEGSPGLLFSFPVFVGSAIALRLFFNWHN